jgi:hypothetical protein
MNSLPDKIMACGKLSAEEKLPAEHYTDADRFLEAMQGNARRKPK